MKPISETATAINLLVSQIDKLIDTNDGHALATQAGKLAIQLEYLLENKADSKRRKNVSYANVYETFRTQGLNQGDSKIYADAKKSTDFDNIEAIESGVKSVLSTVKSKLQWLELENQNKDF